MKLSGRHKRALEKISGKPWDTWQPKAVKAFFAFTDRGDSSTMDGILGKGWKNWCRPMASGTPTKLQEDLFELYCIHIHHPHTVEQWKKDFLPDYERGLPPSLFLWDFFHPQPDYEKWIEEGCVGKIPTFMYPDAYIKHAFEIYKEARGYIPIDEVSGCREWAKKLGIEV